MNDSRENTTSETLQKGAQVAEDELELAVSRLVIALARNEGDPASQLEAVKLLLEIGYGPADECDDDEEDCDD